MNPQSFLLWLLSQDPQPIHVFLSLFAFFWGLRLYLLNTLSILPPVDLLNLVYYGYMVGLVIMALALLELILCYLGHLRRASYVSILLLIWWSWLTMALIYGGFSASLSVVVYGLLTLTHIWVIWRGG